MEMRAARHKNQLPPCYYEGFLEKRSFKDKTSRKLWTCLCGNTLFFFNDKKDTEYIEKIDLSGFISVTDDNTVDRNLDSARFNLLMKNGNIKFTVPNAEARELWKGFIQSVTKLSVPPSVNLLPGQVHMLKEAVVSEKERTSNSSPCVSALVDMPACYYSVSRLEAELLLEREAKRGSLLLRPGRSGDSFAITTRQELGGPVFKHYRVTRKPDGGFIIDVDQPIPCATLHDVINCLVEQSDGVFIPLNMEETYERRISFIRADHENGEKSVQQAVTSLLPVVPDKPVSRSPEPVSASVEAEQIYMNDDWDIETKKEDSFISPFPEPRKNAIKKAMMPPIPAPRKLVSSASTVSSIASANSPDLVKRSNSDCQGQIPRVALSELKLKLEQKAKSNNK